MCERELRFRGVKWLPQRPEQDVPLKQNRLGLFFSENHQPCLTPTQALVYICLSSSKVFPWEQWQENADFVSSVILVASLGWALCQPQSPGWQGGTSAAFPAYVVLPVQEF